MSIEKIKKATTFYSNVALGIDNKVLHFRYRSIKDYFTGPDCLELGPADGMMTQYLKDDFVKLDLVDASQELLDKIPEYNNVQKYCSLFEEYKPEQKYSTIIMEHVLEHIENPVFVLSKVKEWLAPNGRLIVGVPNAKSLHRLAAVKMGLIKSEYELNDRDHMLGHYRVYDTNTLAKDAEDAGLEVIHIGGVFIKPLSNGQIEETWTDEMINAFFLLGKDMPEITAEIFVVCQNIAK
jgi:2-polyprenyl-3-methyl-5-hydroxy-6-metoxy-1,4-benzoquinol methylase